jgi:ubiquitin-protein ligase
MASVASKRIAHDIMSIDRNAEGLANDGIFYFPDEANMKKGLALLVGQSGTPYYGGFYWFSVEFPDDYPFSPIRLLSLTQDGVTRFNPNMYTNGKVCLSILNTWHDGPSWSAIQNLESVLRIVMSDVLVSDPLVNEPAYVSAGGSEKAKMYARQVFHANIATALHKMLVAPPAFAAPHMDLMRSEFAKRAPVLLEHIKTYFEYDGKTESGGVFQMRTGYEFRRLYDQLVAIAAS